MSQRVQKWLCTSCTTVNCGLGKHGQPSASRLPMGAQTAPAGCRFVVLVSGTLVYSRGDEKEAQRLEEEVPPAPEAESLLPGRDSPAMPRAVPVAGSAPISMRQTPSSFKAGTLHAHSALSLQLSRCNVAAASPGPWCLSRLVQHS